MVLFLACGGQLLAVAITLLLVASPAEAEPAPWSGNLSLDIAPYGEFHFTGTGVAEVEMDVSDSFIRQLRLEGGISGTTVIPITDPHVTVSVDSVRISASLGTGTLSPFYPITPTGAQLEKNTLPLRGQMRICTITPDCQFGQAYPFTASGGNRGVGIGGTVTVAGYSSMAVSIHGAPWTLYAASQTIDTTGGGTFVRNRTGFIHGTSSFSQIAGNAGDVLQLVTPMEIRGRTGTPYLPAFAELTIRFLPEPGAGTMLAVGVVGLLLLARKRIQS